MESPPAVKDNYLEVTGVSRSGRVRKKSSKLLDFQSPDEVEARAKIARPTKLPAARQLQLPSATPTAMGGSLLSPSVSASALSLIKMEEPLDILDPEPRMAESIDIADINDDEIEVDDMDTSGDSSDSENALHIDTTVRKSAYMTEKSSKKKVLKDGKLKTQRKDKGKSRYTAYMLWARDVRQELTTNPELDFATISRRLGEMWANVPANEKYNWRRRAKRLAIKGKEKAKIGSPAKVPVSTSKFLNRNAPTGQRAKRNQPEIAAISPSIDANAKPAMVSPVPKSPVVKLSGTAPIDVAAHLKLLGDSLNIIGQRLKEHEGQITVSGSLSVLLDSLLCSIAPLMCLTTCIPGIDISELKDTMSNTLDNIAYVMPGL